MVSMKGRRLLAAALVALLLGCTTAVAASADDPAPAANLPVFIANAGVLGTMVTGLKTLVPGVTITNMTGGSVALAQSIQAGTLNPDIFGSADVNVHRILAGGRESWFAAFARNAIVMQYSPSTASPYHNAFASLASPDDWWKPFVAAGAPQVHLCRTDPDADPSGYYNLLVFQLAENVYNQPGLKQTVLGADRNTAQITNACSAGTPTRTLANGGLDINLTYLSSALGSTTPFVMLPDQVNLGNPDDSDLYARASYTNGAGQTFTGGVIRPGIAPIQGATGAAGAEITLQYIFSHQADLLSTFHFLSSDIYAGGDPAAIPEELRPYFNLRRMNVTVGVNAAACSTDRLAVSGDGVTVTDASGSATRCTVTLEATAGQTGKRDLMVLMPPFKGQGNAFGRKPVSETMTGAVDLADAIPVVPDFLQ